MSWVGILLAADSAPQPNSMNLYRIVPILALSAVLFGCGSPPPVGKTTEQTALESQVNGLKGKLDKMTPDERAKYLREHPEEVNKIAGS